VCEHRTQRQAAGTGSGGIGCNGHDEKEHGTLYKAGGPAYIGGGAIRGRSEISVF
jgi:hypothetical protein